MPNHTLRLWEQLGQLPGGILVVLQPVAKDPQGMGRKNRSEHQAEASYPRRIWHPINGQQGPQDLSKYLCLGLQAVRALSYGTMGEEKLA